MFLDKSYILTSDCSTGSRRGLITFADGKISGSIVNTAEDMKFIKREPDNLEDWLNRNWMKFSGASIRLCTWGVRYKIMLFQKLVAH